MIRLLQLPVLVLVCTAICVSANDQDHHHHDHRDYAPQRPPIFSPVADHRGTPGYLISVYNLNQCAAAGDYACQGTVASPYQVRCIPRQLKCDGIPQCPLGDDEFRCPPRPVTVTETLMVDIISSAIPTYTVQGSSSMITSTTRTLAYFTASRIAAGQTIPTGATMCLSTLVLTNGTTINTAATIVGSQTVTVDLTKSVTVTCTPALVPTPLFQQG